MCVIYYSEIEIIKYFQFRFATKLDVFFIVVALFCAAVKGFAWPAIMIIFGKH